MTGTEVYVLEAEQHIILASRQPGLFPKSPTTYTGSDGYSSLLHQEKVCKPQAASGSHTILNWNDLSTMGQTPSQTQRLTTQVLQ